MILLMGLLISFRKVASDIYEQFKINNLQLCKDRVE
jgi:hypothetical protein